MRILHVYKTFETEEYSGVGKFIQELARGTVEEGHDVDVFCLSRCPFPKVISIDGYKIYRAKLNVEFSSTGFSFEAIDMFISLSNKADIIHYHYPWPFMDILHLLFKPKSASIVTYHSDVVKQKILDYIYSPIRKLFLESIDTILATSENYANSSDILKKYKAKVVVIPLGLAPYIESNVDLDDKLFWSQYLPDKFALFIGALRYYKGLENLLKSAKNCKYGIVIAGDGPLKDNLIDFKRKHSLSNVYILGSISETTKFSLLSLCSCFVFPSNHRSEAFGLSLLEAARASKPMITCDLNTGVNFVNIHDKTGIVIESNNINQLSESINRLCENECLARKYGNNAYIRFNKIFLSSEMVLHYINIYKRHIKKN